MEVIDNLPSNVDVSGLYHRDAETGQIVIDENKMEGVLGQSQMAAAASDLAVATNRLKTQTDQRDSLGSSISRDNHF